MLPTFLVITLLASLTQAAYKFDDPLGPKEFTASYELTTNKPNSGIRDGVLQYSYLQSAYRLQMRQYSELYTFDQPKKFTSNSVRQGSCRESNCLRGVNITSKVDYNPTTEEFSITYSFRPSGSCNITAIILNRLPHCISPAAISVSSACQTTHQLNSTQFCRRSEGLRYPNGGLAFNVCPNTGDHQYTVKMKGAVPGDGLLNFYARTRRGFFTDTACGSVATTVFVCPVDEPQLKFITAPNCNSTCEIGQPVAGGFPALWNSTVIFNRETSPAASSCVKYTRKSSSTNPVVTLYYNETSGTPCSAEFADGRRFNFSSVTPTTFYEKNFTKPAKCNCSSPIDVGVVVHPGCSFREFDDLRESAWSLLSAFDISDRFCRMTVFRSHVSKLSRKLLRLKDGISRQNVFSALYSNNNLCCNRYGGRRMDDDDKYDDAACCGDASLADTIGDAADEIYNTSVTRNYATTKAIVVFVTNLTDAAIPAKLTELRTKYPDLVVYFVSLLFDPQFVALDLSTFSNAQVLSRSDWVYWRRIPLQLIGSVCSQVKNPCGDSCCGDCVCKQCIPSDRCPPLVNPATPCSGNVLKVDGCCAPSPISCDDTQQDVNSCLDRFCNATSQTCETKSLCPPPDTLFNYVCQSGVCVAVANGNLAGQIAAAENIVGPNVGKCSTAIVDKNGQVQVVTSKYCQLSTDFCGLTRSYCSAPNTCTYEWVNQVPDTCVSLTCSSAGSPFQSCNQVDQYFACPKQCNYEGTNASLNYATINPNKRFVENSTEPDSLPPACDGTRSGICVTQPANCSIDQQFDVVSGQCIPKILSEYCPLKTGLVATNVMLGMCIYKPAICPAQDCRSRATIWPSITLVQIASDKYDCLDANNISIGDGYNPNDQFVNDCLANSCPLQLAAEYNCKNPPRHCIKEGNIRRVLTIPPFNGSVYCDVIISSNDNLCLSTSNNVCLSNGLCAITPRFPISVDEACTQTTLAPNATSCNIITTPRVCSVPNKCYEYQCDPVVGCVAFEKCGTTKCGRFTCTNADTGECTKIEDIVPLNLRTPCVKLVADSCNNATGEWQYTNFCDDNNTDTEDVCSLVDATTPTCSYYCKNDYSTNACKLKVYNPVTKSCDIVQNPNCAISNILNDKAIIASLNCSIGDKCQQGRLVGDSCVFSSVDCADNDPCTIDTCEPTIGCVHTQNNCNNTQDPSIDSCGIYSCQTVYDPVAQQYTGKCVKTAVQCASSVRIEVVVVVAVLTVGAVIGIVIAIVVVGAASAGTAYYVKLNVAPEEEPETKWNDAYDKKDAPRRGGANPVHKRH